jgi:hypothetical protein
LLLCCANGRLWPTPAADAIDLARQLSGDKLPSVGTAHDGWAAFCCANPWPASNANNDSEQEHQPRGFPVGAFGSSRIRAARVPAASTRYTIER